MTEVTGETIVVGVDGSPCGQQALEWAIAEAKRSGRDLLIVHVWHWVSAVKATPFTLVGAPVGREAARAVLDKAGSLARESGVQVRTRLIEGFGAEALVAASGGAAMLVVGSHGHGPLASAFLGSVSRGCVQHADCPVVVVPSRARAAAKRTQPERAMPAGASAGREHRDGRQHHEDGDG